MRIAILGALLASVLSAQTIAVSEIELKLDQPEQSLAQLWGAAAQNPKSAGARVQVGFALLSLKRGQLLLGWTLAREYRYTDEALENLRGAAHAYPEAHLGAADVLAHLGLRAEACGEVASYLAAGNAEHRKIAESWLKALTAN
jgi:hypothetical protein